MKNEKKTEIKVGLTVLFGLILLALVYGWVKNFSLTSDNRFLSLEFPTVAGLENGDMVSVNGVRKGLVESIESGDNIAIVKIKFDEEIPLKEDATFSIMMLDLMGGKKIEINSGLSDILLDFNITHKGIFAGDISSAMATLYSVENDLVDVIGEMKNSLESANSLLGNKNFTNDLSESLDNLNSLTKNLNELITENKESFTRSVSNIEQLSAKTNSLIDQNSENLNSLIKNMDSTLSASNILINKISKFTDEVEGSENNLGKILYDEELISDLKASLIQIKEMTGLINEQLKSGGLEVKADVDLFSPVELYYDFWNWN